MSFWYEITYHKNKLLYLRDLGVGQKIHDFVSKTVFYFLLSSACFYGAIHENFSPMSDNFGQKK